MFCPSIGEAEELATSLLASSSTTTHVDIVPSAYRLTRKPSGELERTTSVLVVANGGSGGGGVVVQEVKKEVEEEEEVIPEWEAKWLSSPEMVKQRMQARNLYDDDLIMAGGDAFFFQPDGQGEGKEKEEGDKGGEDDDDSGTGSGYGDIDEESHMSLLGW